MSVSRDAQAALWQILARPVLRSRRQKVSVADRALRSGLHVGIINQKARRERARRSGGGRQASDRGTWRDERVGPGRNADGARRLSLIFPVAPHPRGCLPFPPRLTHFQRPITRLTGDVSVS
ncbi:jg19827 [Pararge aegeria aegeria]|uniref:Jg19827 protein n=1 Tax=Pararge aegeria aegeria TaxID=348720 RepID=A0A8S4SDF8_9NEOP|nr:jg19827 [Pararge aegeria aegeria]